MRLTRSLIASALLLCTAAPAFADATVFIGNNATPENRQVKGFAFGISLLIVGFEFEYASTDEKPEEAAPALRTGMGNVFLQTPFPILGLQPYVTTGAGGFRERLGTVETTHVGFNTGGGVKVSLLGPLRARVDYRVFKLNGDALHPTVQRLYAGLNLAF